MSKSTPLTEAEVRTLAEDWYKKLDVHAPMVEVLPMLAESELKMKFPEATLQGQAEFEGWYQGVIRIFFDEVHQLKDFNVELSGDTANVKLVVKWEASRWNPPARSSDRIVMDAAQTWIVKRSPESGKAVIETYIVDDLTYYDGSAQL